MILLENDYPLDFIFGMINDRIHHLKKKKIGLQESSNIDNSMVRTVWFTVHPYHQSRKNLIDSTARAQKFCFIAQINLKKFINFAANSYGEFSYGFA